LDWIGSGFVAGMTHARTTREART